VIKNPYKVGSQKYQILEEMILKGKAEIWKMITPKPMGGMGIALYTARITEMRRELWRMGYDIENEPGRFYYLKKRFEQEKLI
jgi:hypothetical protein